LKVRSDKSNPLTGSLKVIARLSSGVARALGLTAAIAAVTGGSSLLIVQMPWLSAIDALAAPLRLTTKGSLASLNVSPLTSTVMVAVVMLGANDALVPAD